MLPLLAVDVLVVLATLPYRSENILPATQFLLGLLAVMERSSVLRVDGGRLAPCRGRLGRRVKMIVTFVSLLPHARLFSRHPSLVSQNSCQSHGLGMHGVDCQEGYEGLGSF